MGKITREEIARAAKVSPSTVSRALSGNPLIPEKTALKIRRLALEKGYVPNIAARRLVSRKSWQIGFAMEFDGQRVRRGPIQMGYYSGILDGVISAASPEGYSVSIQPYVADNLESAINFLNILESGAVDGFVFAGLRRESPMLEHLKSHQAPIVLIGMASQGLPSVELDYLCAYREAFSSITIGPRQRIIFIEGDKSFSYAIKQRKALEIAVKESSIRIAKIFSGDYSMSCGYSLAPEILKSSRRGDCAIFANDRMAAGFYRHCHENKIEIPARIGVVGCDKDPSSEALFPLLSTIVQPRLEMGASAFRLLLSIVKGKGLPKQIILEQRFLKRDSSW